MNIKSDNFKTRNTKKSNIAILEKFIIGYRIFGAAMIFSPTVCISVTTLQYIYLTFFSKLNQMIRT